MISKDVKWGGNFIGDFEDSLLDLFKGLKDLFLDEMNDRLGISFNDGYAAGNGYCYELPSLEFDINENSFQPDTSDEGSHEDCKTQLEEEGDDTAQITQTPAHAGYSSYYGDIIIRRVPRYNLGYGVLGRAFPRLRLVEIASDLYGQEFDEVKTHEILHVKNPGMSEMEIRRLTKEILPFAPRFH